MQSKTEWFITITLSQREAEWLRAYVQNDPVEWKETAEEGEMRTDLFDALDSADGE